MLAAWNESDSTKVRVHLERALDPAIEFIDPSITTNGIDAFEANVHQVHESLPGARYSHTSRLDSHHQLYRYCWQVTQNGEVVLDGFDVTELSEDNKVLRVLGFFGRLAEDL